jgi:hypothetical protein
MLQPVAHTLLQARLEINEWCREREDLSWNNLRGYIPAFHLQHIPGVLVGYFTRIEQLMLNS